MGKITANQKLDEVLRVLVENKVRWMDFDEIIGNCKKEYQDDGIIFLIQPIIDKLIKDGYAMTIVLNDIKLGDPKQTKTPTNNYKATFDAIHFYENNGYEGKFKFDVYENNRLEKIEKNQKKNQRLMTWLTGVVAFGTLIAAIYYAIEIYKFFCLNQK